MAHFDLETVQDICRNLGAGGLVADRARSGAAISLSARAWMRARKDYIPARGVRGTAGESD